MEAAPEIDNCKYSREAYIRRCGALRFRPPYVERRPIRFRAVDRLIGLLVISQ